MPRPDTVSIVACGPSALACGAASAPGLVVAINGAYKHVPFAVSFTMDGRFSRNCWRDLTNRWCVWRHSAVKHAMDAGAQGLMANVDGFACDPTSTTFSTYVDPVTGEPTYSGSNSGYCALNFAYAARPRRVYLYGFDMREPTHFFGDYPWKGEGDTLTREKLARWAREMSHARRQFDAAGIQVFNTNPNSAISAFEYGRPRA